MKKNVENKIRKGGLVKLNAAGEAHVASCNRYRTNSAVSGANPLRHAYFGKSKFTSEDREAYNADIQKQIAEAKAAGEDAWHSRCETTVRADFLLLLLVLRSFLAKCTPYLRHERLVTGTTVSTVDSVSSWTPPPVGKFMFLVIL